MCSTNQARTCNPRRSSWQLKGPKRSGNRHKRARQVRLVLPNRDSGGVVPGRALNCTCFDLRVQVGWFWRWGTGGEGNRGEGEHGRGGRRREGEGGGKRESGRGRRGVHQQLSHESVPPKVVPLLARRRELFKFQQFSRPGAKGNTFARMCVGADCCWSITLQRFNWKEQEGTRKSSK